MIYLDNAATTRVFPQARDAMDKYFCEEFFNPSALYGVALGVKNAIEDARERVSGILGCQRDEIFFTSCATESNNWVFNSGRKYKKGNVVTTLGEHPSVFEAASELRGKGVDVRFASLASDGTVNTEDLYKKIDSETALVSIIHCSNETGAINDLKRIIENVRRLAPRALIHSDGVQAFCKIETNLKDLDVDFYSLSAHKVGGAKGVGALFINKKHNIAPLLYGGGQEKGLRSGTENTAGIVSFAIASEIYYNKAKKLLMNSSLKGLRMQAVANGFSTEDLAKAVANGFSTEDLAKAVANGFNTEGLARQASAITLNVEGLARQASAITLNVEGLAREVVASGFDSEIKRMRDHMLLKLVDLGGVVINGTSKFHSNYILSASISGIRGEILQHMLSDKGIYIGLGSACSSKSKQNRVLSALGRTGKEIEGSIRISLCVDNTMDEIKTATEVLVEKITELRGRINGR